MFISTNKIKDISEANFNQLFSRYSNTYLIVSPPRCGSTAFARVFWEHPTIGYYYHEPFDIVYHEKADLGAVADKLQNPITLKLLQNGNGNVEASSLVIKEMTFQVGKYFPLLATWTNRPIVFLIRDPRLNIASRIDKMVETHNCGDFPFIETGWETLVEQIRYCRKQGISHFIIDSTDFRANPTAVFQQLFQQLNLSFSKKMLTWKAYPQMVFGNLGGGQKLWYKKVLHSKGILSPTEIIPNIEEFPIKNGLRSHVRYCLNLYQELLKASERIVLDQINNI